MKIIWVLLTCFVCQLYALDVISLNDRPQKDADSSAVGVLSLFPVKQHNTSAQYLVARDHLRHGRILKRSRTASAGVINFTLTGSFDPDLDGIYYSKIKLGTPPREYNMLIDTGSEISWVSCSSCKNCPRSNLRGEMNFYDTNSSSTATIVPCHEPICASNGCNGTNQCSYSVKYADKSTTSGFYVLDMLYLDAIQRTLQITESTAPFIFGRGCSTSRSGGLGLSNGPDVDGILGFNRRSISIISQLYSHQISPKVFSHCLRGEGSGGGILVLGEVSHPSMVYSPLVPSMGNYYVYLQSIAIQGSIVPINPVTFETSANRGTIFDSGTTLVYIVTEAYESMVKAITTMVSPSAKPIMTGTDDTCYLISSSLSNNIAKVFPTISLNFAGGASMDLRPMDYLKKMNYFEGAATWCFYYVKSNPSLTVIGDAALKDRVVVYDLARQRIGWADYNCSLPLNVSISAGIDKAVHPGAFDHLIKLILISYLFWI